MEKHELDKYDLLYEGKAKKVFKTDNPEEVIIYFKDDATAFDGDKKGTILQKGFYNNKISNILFKTIEDKSKIKTHLINELSERSILARNIEIILVEIVVRNVAAGSLVKRLGLTEGTIINPPIIEYYYKNDELHDPMINIHHIKTLNLATEKEIDIVTEMAFNINIILSEKFKKADIDVVDFKLEFGRFKGDIILGDEISPDTLRLWDSKTKKKLDKDRFRFDLGGVESTYAEVYNRLCSI